MNARALIVAAAMFAVGTSGAWAQVTKPDSADQLPRFLRAATAASREPQPVDPAASAVLSRRIAVGLRDVTRGAALQEIALAASLQFVYAGDLLPRDGVVRLQADNITVAAALTKVLRGAGVDVVVGGGANLILMRKPPARNATAGAPGSRAAERAVELAPVMTLAMAESRRTFEVQPTMGHLELGVKDLAAAPAPIEGDLFRTVRLLPGVEARNDYSAGLNVRGGESDQNLILLDGYPIYNPFHLGGLLGTFIDPMVGNVDLLTGAAPVRYGERLSSVLDVRSADESRHGRHGALDVSLLAATATVGSAFAGGGGWTIGGRHTYGDVIANAIKRNSLPYGFSDVQAHLTRPLSGNTTLSLTAYDGADGSSLSQDNGGLDISWGNRLLGATIASLIPRRTVALGVFPADSVALVQRVSLTTFDAAALVPTAGFDLRSSVRDVRASGAATLFTRSFDQSAGYEIAAQHLHYSMQSPVTGITNFLPRATLDQSVTPLSGWYDALWRASPNLMVDGGVRVDAVGGAGWTGVSPRISIKYFLTKDLALIGATGSYAQWLHSLAQDDAPIQPLEFWVASGGAGPVSRSWQSSLGVEAWTSDTRHFRVEAFYKKYSNLMEVNASADSSTGGAPFVELGGTSYGADVLLRQMDNGRFGGWIAYSYAVSDRVTAAGAHFAPGHDRRHELNAVGTWKSGRYRLSARLGLATGTPYTPIVGEFTRERYSPLGNGYAPDEGGTATQYLAGPLNGARLPFAHRLDVSITRTGTGERVQVSPYLSIANVYGANNPAMYFYDYGQTKVVAGARVPDPVRLSVGNLPFLPSIGVHIAY